VCSLNGCLASVSNFCFDNFEKFSLLVSLHFFMSDIFYIHCQITVCLRSNIHFSVHEYFDLQLQMSDMTSHCCRHDFAEAWWCIQFVWNFDCTCTSILNPQKSVGLVVPNLRRIAFLFRYSPCISTSVHLHDKHDFDRKQFISI
jgi:hypothetical protein